MSTQKPKSIEIPRGLAWDVLKLAEEPKGNRQERKVQVEILKALEAIEGFNKREDGGFSRDYPVPMPDLDNVPEEEHQAKRQEWSQGMLDWLNEMIFVELSKKARNFVWATFFRPQWEDAIDLAYAERLKEVAGYLGKAGALADMEADLEEWQDAEEDDAEVDGEADAAE